MFNNKYVQTGVICNSLHSQKGIELRKVKTKNDAAKAAQTTLYSSPINEVISFKYPTPKIYI